MKERALEKKNIIPYLQLERIIITGTFPEIQAIYKARLWRVDLHRQMSSLFSSNESSKKDRCMAMRPKTLFRRLRRKNDDRWQQPDPPTGVAKGVTEAYSLALFVGTDIMEYAKDAIDDFSVLNEADADGCTLEDESSSIIESESRKDFSSKRGNAPCTSGLTKLLCFRRLSEKQRNENFNSLTFPIDPEELQSTSKSTEQATQVGVNSTVEYLYEELVGSCLRDDKTSEFRADNQDPRFLDSADTSEPSNVVVLKYKPAMDDSPATLSIKNSFPPRVEKEESPAILRLQNQDSASESSSFASSFASSESSFVSSSESSSFASFQTLDLEDGRQSEVDQDSVDDYHPNPRNDYSSNFFEISESTTDFRRKQILI